MEHKTLRDVAFDPSGCTKPDMLVAAEDVSCGDIIKIIHELQKAATLLSTEVYDMRCRASILCDEIARRAEVMERDTRSKPNR